MKIKKGNFRKVFIFKNIVIKLAINFNGFISNLDEFASYIRSSNDIKKYLAKTYFSLGVFNIQERCIDIRNEQHLIDLVSMQIRQNLEKCGCKNYYIGNDLDYRNIGISRISGRYVQTDYANHWLISNLVFPICNKLTGKKCKECKSKKCIRSYEYEWR